MHKHVRPVRIHWPVSTCDLCFSVLHSSKILSRRDRCHQKIVAWLSQSQRKIRTNCFLLHSYSCLEYDAMPRDSEAIWNPDDESHKWRQLWRWQEQWRQPWTAHDWQITQEKLTTCLVWSHSYLKLSATSANGLNIQFLKVEKEGSK